MASGGYLKHFALALQIDRRVFLSNERERVRPTPGNSALRPDGIQAIFLWMANKATAKPLTLLLIQSLDESSIKRIHKMADVFLH